MNKKKLAPTKGGVDWQPAPDIDKRIKHLVDSIDEINWVNIDNVACFRSTNSKARAYARIWGLPKIWQLSLNIEPHYTIEVLAEKFDNLPQHKKDEVLLHELAHIPKNFSGALLPHRRRGKGNFHDKLKGMIGAYRKIK